MKLTKKCKEIDQIKNILKTQMPKAISAKILEFNNEYHNLGSKPEEEKKHIEEKKLFEAISKGIPVEAAPAASTTTEEIKKTQPADASAWNANAYHWEEKKVGEWASNRLKEILLNTQIEKNGLKGTICEIKNLAGDVNFYGIHCIGFSKY